MPNLDLMYQVLDHIEAHPDAWDQGSWANCFAGITCKVSGYQLRVEPLPCECCTKVSFVGSDEAEWQASTLARILLRINNDMSSHLSGHLFSGRNKLDDLKRIVASYGPRPAKLTQADIDTEFHQLIGNSLVSA